MPLRDVYERTFDERVLLSRSDEEQTVEEEQSGDRKVHSADESTDPTGAEVTRSK